MRRFSSYGPVDTDLHYYVPREALINQALNQLLGDDPAKGGHYITVWAPRQHGKTWLMREVMERVRANVDFEVAILSMQSAKNVDTIRAVLDILTRNLRDWFEREFPVIETIADLQLLFPPHIFPSHLS